MCHRTGASNGRSSIAVDRFSFDGGRLASKRSIRSVLLLLDFAFTGPGECYIQPTTSGMLALLLCAHPHAKLCFCSSLLMHTLTGITLVLPFPGAYQREAAAARNCRRFASSHRVLVPLVCPSKSLGLRGRQGRSGSFGQLALAHAEGSSALEG